MSRPAERQYLADHIDATYPGTCRACGLGYGKGAKITKSIHGLGWVHRTCRMIIKEPG